MRSSESEAVIENPNEGLGENSQVVSISAYGIRTHTPRNIYK